MKVALTGASGYIGKALTQKLRNEKIEVAALKREIINGPLPNLAEILKNTNIVINLAGSVILRRWTRKNKNVIYESRIKTTLNLVHAINSLAPGERPSKFISASAIGIYKPGELHDDFSTNYDQGFLGNLVKDWEYASQGLPGEVTRTIFRIGLVLGKESKTLKTMALPFKLGLGATIGHGKQAFPFIHIDDVVNAFYEAIINDELSGKYNLVAPHRINNKEFTKTFAKSLNRPAFLFVPGFLLKIIFGEAAGLLIQSPEVIPERLTRTGFKFEIPTLDDIFNKN